MPHSTSGKSGMLSGAGEPGDDPVAIVGMGCRWPGSVHDPSSLWTMLESKRTAQGRVPASRFNVDAVYHANKARPGSIHCDGGYFLSDDVRQFDPGFFGIGGSEAQEVDPQQRKLLETVYEAFEASGTSLDDVSGTRTACFAGCFTSDYLKMVGTDPEAFSSYSTTGTGVTILSNRVSYVFNLKGPSMTLDTACSSAMYAFHLACKAIKNNDADQAVVCGTNLILNLEQHLGSAKLGVLSPTSTCHTFDISADGYGRADGVGALFLKPLSKALADGNPIRAIVRGTAFNANGRTGGITTPDAAGHEAVIRHAYADAGISFADTTYFECHGTGTPVGDPIEIDGIGRVFAPYHSPDSPLLVGSVKTNLGHSEAASGIAGIMKVVLALEHGIIPPSAGVKTLNPKIDFAGTNTEVVTACTPWPTTRSGVRRASVNSFGYGGANAHCILEAYQPFPASETAVDSPKSSSESPRPTQQRRPSMPRRTHTRRLSDALADFGRIFSRRSRKNSSASVFPSPPRSPTASPAERDFPSYFANESWTFGRKSSGKTTTTKTHNSFPATSTTTANDKVVREAYLLLFSANSEPSLTGIWESHSKIADKHDLRDLAYTLGTRRSRFIHRGFAIAGGKTQLTPFVTGKKSRKEPVLGFVFTGQGAQWPRMGRELLLQFQIFRDTIRTLDAVLASLPEAPEWTLESELLAPSETSKINTVAVCQPICTAVQVAYIALLASWGVKAVGTVGHSSGEIAAAHAAGYLSASDAIVVAFYRGLGVAGQAHDGAMLAVGLGPEDVAPYLNKGLNVTIACINSPASVTLSGAAADIARVQKKLVEKEILARLLKTDRNAYHSRFMAPVGGSYAQKLDARNLHVSKATTGIATMISSVTGEPVTPQQAASGAYWRQNLESPVRFDVALSGLLQAQTDITHLLEIGPHSALAGPIKQILRSVGKVDNITYIPAMLRNADTAETALSVAGRLFLEAFPIDMLAVNGGTGARVLKDLPTYSWNYSKLHWREPRASVRQRTFGVARHDILGKRELNAGAPKRMTWRNVLRVRDVPWLEDHKMAGEVYFPGAGFVATALEAMMQYVEEQAASGDGEVGEAKKLVLKGLNIKQTLMVPDTTEGVETLFYLQPAALSRKTNYDAAFELAFCSLSSNGEWFENFTCTAHVDFASAANIANSPTNSVARRVVTGTRNADLRKRGDARFWYEVFDDHDMTYGPAFRPMAEIETRPGIYEAAAQMKMHTATALMPAGGESRYFVHPAAIDGCFQLMIIAAHAGEVRKLKSRLVPHDVDEVVLHLPAGEQKLTEGQTCRTEATGYSVARKAVGTTALFTADGARTPVLEIREAKFAAFDVQHGAAATRTERYPYMRQFWKPDIDFMTNSSLRALHPTGGRRENGDTNINSLVHKFLAFNRLSIIAIARIVISERLDYGNYVPPADHPYLAYLVDFYVVHYRKMRRGEIPYAADMAMASPEILEREYEILRPRACEIVEGQLVDRIFQIAPKLLRGEANYYDAARPDGLSSRIYSEGQGSRAANVQLAAALDVLAHKNPDMAILEVGAGTGGATRVALDVLGGKSRMKRYKEYCFTDITTGFLGRAQQEFSECHDMVYKTFDVTKGLEEQGFAAESYDMILATNAIHVTPDLVASLTTVHKLLKPGGRLVLLETTTEQLGGSFIFGTLRDWWVGRDEGRLYTPMQSLKKWRKSLTEAGFSGLDYVLDDYPALANVSSIIVSTAVAAPVQIAIPAEPVWPLTTTFKEPPTPIYIVYRPGKSNRNLTLRLESALRACKAIPILLPLTSNIGMPPRSRTICLAEAGAPFLTALEEDSWEGLKTVISQSASMIWVTTGGFVKGLRPEYGTANGWMRAVMLEQPQINLYGLDLESIDGNFEVEIPQIVALEQKLWDERANPEKDFLFAISDGIMHLPRVYEDEELNMGFARDYATSATTTAAIGSEECMSFQLEKLGALDNFFFKPKPFPARLEPTHVEVKVKAWGVNNKGVLSVMGKYDGDGFCYEAAGIVSAVGSEVSGLTVGQRVVVLYEGNFDTTLRIHHALCAPIADTDGFAEMCSFPTTHVTAVHTMLKLANVQRGEKVLIHSGTGGLGLALIQVAKYVGAEIFVTVGNDKKREWLVENQGIEASNIFLRKDFYDPLMKVTNKKGVNVVFNTLAEEALHQSFACVGKLGRFVELGFGDVFAHGRLDLGGFKSNISFMAFNLALHIVEYPETIAPMWDLTMSLYRAGHLAPLMPLTTYKASEFDQAIRNFANTTRLGKVVVLNENPTEEVRFLPAPPMESFRPDGAYLIIAGLGGLGRSISQWMINRGARTLIFLSRSCGTRPAEQQSLAEFRAQGVTCIVNRGSVANAEDVVRCISASPVPLRGVFHGAMVLVDSLFHQMSPAQFNAVLHPKALGAINLHEATKHLDLDFFVLASSIAAITGTATQSNYAAANSYLDAFARWRRNQGLPAVCIDIGMIGEVGYAAETPVVVDALLRNGIQVVYEHEFKHMMSAALFRNPKYAVHCGSDPHSTSSLVMGMEPTRLKQLWKKGFGGGGVWTSDKLFKIMMAASVEEKESTAESGATGGTVDVKSQVKGLSKDDGLDVLIGAICYRMSKLLLINAAEIDSGKAPIDYGIDSMVGADLRHWFFSTLATDLPFSVILSPKTTVRGLAERSFAALSQQAAN